MISVEEDAGELFFDNLIEPWGHTTIQIVFFDIRFFKEITEPLEKINCSWEGSHVKEYISVDIPTEVDYSHVKVYLRKMVEEKKLITKKVV